MSEEPFAKVPVVVFMDDRLTKTDLRVLGSILSYLNQQTGLAWPKREQIEKRCGLPACKISTSTTHLVKLGWLKKHGKGGFSQPTKYEFMVPEQFKTVTDSVTVTNSVTVTDSVIKTVTDSVTRNKQTSEQTISSSSSTARAKSDDLGVNPKTKTGGTRSAKNPGFPIEDDWQPSDRCFNAFARAGISREFAEGLIDEFRIYWKDTEKERLSWDSTFINRVKSQWEIKNQNPPGKVNGSGFNTGGNYGTKQPISQSEWESTDF